MVNTQTPDFISRCVIMFPPIVLMILFITIVIYIAYTDIKKRNRNIYRLV